MHRWILKYLTLWIGEIFIIQNRRVVKYLTVWPCWLSWLYWLHISKNFITRDVSPSKNGFLRMGWWSGWEVGRDWLLVGGRHLINAHLRSGHSVCKVDTSLERVIGKSSHPKTSTLSAKWTPLFSLRCTLYIIVAFSIGQVANHSDSNITTIFCITHTQHTHILKWSTST